MKRSFLIRAGAPRWAALGAIFCNSVPSWGATPPEVTAAPVELQAAPAVVPVQPEPPRYAPPPALKRFRYAKPPAEDTTIQPATLRAADAVAPVDATGAAPQYKMPDSLQHWRKGATVPLYADPDAAPWQATPVEPRLQNAAVSCNYKDEGGVRGRVTLLVDDFKVTRLAARIAMPNGGVCAFDSRKMTQRPFEQGIALASKTDECVIRMWEQDTRITIAAYSCHKQCSKGSFSYLWPILMDTRVGTCY